MLPSCTISLMKNIILACTTALSKTSAMGHNWDQGPVSRSDPEKLTPEKS